jgi:putative transposase
MQQIITSKLKLLTTKEQSQALRQTQMAYRDALNFVSLYSFEHGKMANAERLQQGTYRDIREHFKLTGQMACNAVRQVAATYRGLWTKLKRNAVHRKAKITKKRFRGLDKPPKYFSPTINFNYRHDYTFKSGNRVSVRTLHGRIIMPYHGYERHESLIRHGAVIRGAKLWFDKRHKQFYLLVSLEREIADPEPEVQCSVVGVDVGQRYLATTATLKNKSWFFSGKAVRAKADHYARLQKRLQRKGTRSAKRRMIAMSGRERRFKLEIDHVIAKTIVDAHPHALIGLENLTGIRERNPRCKRRRKEKRVLPLTSKQRRANRHASKWAFAELQVFISYKAAIAESLAIKVDADHTSQTCPICGNKGKQNRPRNGLLFICQNNQCPYRIDTGNAYTLHADLIAARNIAMRTLCVWHDWTQTGQLSVAPGSELGPDASDVELKAAKLSRLERFAELRWESGCKLSSKDEAI